MLSEGDALALPFDDESFDHVWMMWFLEHLTDPPAALREARRVLVEGGAITAIEVDYWTCHAQPSTPAMEALFDAMVRGMAASGWSDAGTRLPGWLREAGFRDIDEGERSFRWEAEDLAGQAGYAADVIESAFRRWRSYRAQPRRSSAPGSPTCGLCPATRAPRWAGSSTSRRRWANDRTRVRQAETTSA